jgi:hypothetical protein
MYRPHVRRSLALVSFFEPLCLPLLSSRSIGKGSDNFSLSILMSGTTVTGLPPYLGVDSQRRSFYPKFGFSALETSRLPSEKPESLH